MANRDFKYTMEIFKGAAERKVIKQDMLRHYDIERATRLINHQAETLLLEMMEVFHILDMEIPRIEIRWEYDGVGQGHYIDSVTLQVTGRFAEYLETHF